MRVVRVTMSSGATHDVLVASTVQAGQYVDVIEHADGIISGHSPAGRGSWWLADVEGTSPATRRQVLIVTRMIESIEVVDR